MFINETVLSKQKSSAKRQIIIGTVLSVFFLFGIIGGLTGDEELKKGFSVYILFLIPSAYLLFLGIRKMKLLDVSVIYNEIFKADLDGEISILELSSKMRTSQNVVIKEMRYLLKKQIFNNCSLEFGNNSSVILSKAVAKKKGSSMVDVVMCESCGAKNTIRHGFAGKCEYCGSALLRKS